MPDAKPTSDLNEKVLTKQEFIAFLEAGCPECRYQPEPNEPAYKNSPKAVEFLCPKCGAHTFVSLCGGKYDRQAN